MGDGKARKAKRRARGVSKGQQCERRNGALLASVPGYASDLNAPVYTVLSFAACTVETRTQQNIENVEHSRFYALGLVHVEDVYTA